MREEVQAELQLGIENSLGLTSAAMTANLRIFAENGEEWRDVEAEIAASGDVLARVEPAGATELQAAAPHESASWLAAWQGDWPRALDQARRVTHALRGGRAPQRYAALWHYLASC